MARMRRAVPAWVLVLCLTSCGDGPTTPGAGGGDPVYLVVSPGAVLLPNEGATQQLRAYTVDADGDSTEVDATFESSSPPIAAVDGAGLVTGGGPIGSAQIIARAAGLTSAPVLALRATPAAGALLVGDDQIVGGIEAVDPGATYQPGWRHRLTLRGAAPAVGQVVLASGGAPVAGRAVSVAPTGDGSLVELELLAIDEMFTELVVNERLSLANIQPTVSAEARGAFQVRRAPGNRLRFTPRTRETRWRSGESRVVRNGAVVEQLFELGQFDCKAEVPAPITFPITLDVADLEVSHQLELDLRIENLAVRRLVVSGGISSRLEANPLVTAALEAKAECKTVLATFTIPVWGPLSAIVGGQVPLGVGFELGTKVNLGQFGFDAFIDAAIAAEFGVDCSGDCTVVGDLTSDDPAAYFRPVIPTLSEDTRVELSLGAFGLAELAIGNRWLQELQFKTVEIKGGLEQKFDLWTRAGQVKDAAYRSSFSLKPVVEAKSAANLAAVADLLKINLATFAYAPDLPALAQSPHGTFVITPQAVAAGDGTALGEKATFTVTLTNPTYLQAYAIESVELQWLRDDGSGGTTLQAGRPGCHEIEAAQDQTSFSCETDFLEEHAGEQTFFAFVNTRIFGVPVPVPLEVANDSKAIIVVTAPAHGGLIELEEAGGSATARTRYPSTGTQCEDEQSFDQGVPPVLQQRTVKATCADGSVGPEGNALTANGNSESSYQLTGTPAAVSALHVTGNSAASATGAAAPAQLDNASGTAGSTLGFTLLVIEPATVTVSGTLTAAIPNQSADVIAAASMTFGRYGDGGPLVNGTAGRTSSGAAAQPSLSISSTFQVAPGSYYFQVSTTSGADSDPDHPSVSGNAAYDITVTVTP